MAGEVLERLRAGASVLLVWGAGAGGGQVERLAAQVEARTGRAPACHRADLLAAAQRSSYDAVLSDWTSPGAVEHTDALLASVALCLKPCGVAVLTASRDISTSLKLNGLINVCRIRDHVYAAEKSDFEVGSKQALKLSARTGDAGGAWKLQSDQDPWADNHDDDIIDSDQLLEQGDLEKPDPASLRVCASTGQRKACADCSCGLAEELQGTTATAPTSSCGSCYLGDAFRCASCPYLGMPAFRPGERVLLADLKPDI